MQKLTGYKRRRKWINKLSQRIKADGFRVFIAANGEYGFFTDQKGLKVICFQIEYLHFAFSGNYKTSQPSGTGTGWRITETDGNYVGIYNSMPPSWAVGSSKWKFTTLKEHLATYQKSSNYSEV